MPFSGLNEQVNGTITWNLFCVFFVCVGEIQVSGCWRRNHWWVWVFFADLTFQELSNVLVWVSWESQFDCWLDITYYRADPVPTPSFLSHWCPGSPYLFWNSVHEHKRKPAQYSQEYSALARRCWRVAHWAQKLEKRLLHAGGAEAAGRAEDSDCALSLSMTEAAEWTTHQSALPDRCCVFLWMLTSC